TTTLAHHKPLLPVDPVELLVVHPKPLTPQQKVQSPVAEPAAYGRQLFQARAQHTISHSPRPMPVNLRRQTDQRTRPALGVFPLLDRPPHGRSPCGGRQKFFASISFSVALSITCSARSFLSLRFSSSSAFSRFASDTSSPPNFDFHE